MNKNKSKKEENEFDPYSVDKLSRVPLVLKIFIIKYWGAGAAAMFVYLGLNQYLPVDQFGNLNYDAHAVYWIIAGLFIDLLMNKLIRMMGNPMKPTQKYIFVNGSSAFTIFGNILYACVTWFVIVFTYNKVLFLIFRDRVYELSANWSPFNPFTWALLFVICDALFLLVKNLIIKLYKKFRYGKENVKYEDEI